MKNKRSRLARMGILALALSVVVGMASGSVADAKKKKGAKSITVAQTAPTAIPAGIASTATSAGKFGFAQVPLTVGKKAKGKVVGWDSVSLTTTFTGSSPQALQSVFMELTAPNGRTVGNSYESILLNPISDSVSATTGNLVSGPLTETPDSPFKICPASYPPFTPFNPPQPPCANSERTVGPPYAGTVGNNGLSFLNGVPAKGTWLVKLFNTSPVDGNPAATAVLNSVTLSMTLKKNPPAA
jgi:hypothetical protein